MSRSVKRRRRYEMCHVSFGAWVEVKKGRLRRSKGTTVNRGLKYFRNLYLHSRWSTYRQIPTACFLNVSSLEVVSLLEMSLLRYLGYVLR